MRRILEFEFKYRFGRGNLGAQQRNGHYLERRHIHRRPVEHREHGCHNTRIAACDHCAGSHGARNYDRAGNHRAHGRYGLERRHIHRHCVHEHRKRRHNGARIAACSHPARSYHSYKHGFE